MRSAESTASSSRRDVVHRQDALPPGKGFLQPGLILIRSITGTHPRSVNLPSSSCWPLGFGIDRPCSHLLVSGADVRPRATPGLVPLPFVRPLRKWARADLEHVTILIGIVTCSCRSRSSMRTTGGTVAEVCPADQTFARGRGGSAAVSWRLPYFAAVCHAPVAGPAIDRRHGAPFTSVTRGWCAGPGWPEAGRGPRPHAHPAWAGLRAT